MKKNKLLSHSVIVYEKTIYSPLSYLFSAGSANWVIEYYGFK